MSLVEESTVQCSERVVDARNRVELCLSVLWSREPGQIGHHRVGQQLRLGEVTDCHPLGQSVPDLAAAAGPRAAPVGFGRGEEPLKRPHATRLMFFYPRPGAEERGPPVEANRISRDHLRFQVISRGDRVEVEVENRGGRPLLVNGEPVQANGDGRQVAVAQIGDLIEIAGYLIFILVARPSADWADSRYVALSYPPSAEAGSGRPPGFGEPDPLGLIGEGSAMWRTRAQAWRAVESKGHVLILGPRGPERALLAERLARQRQTEGELHRFIPSTVAPGLISERLFGGPTQGDATSVISRAAGGVLLIEELGDLPRRTLAALLARMQADAKVGPGLPMIIATLEVPKAGASDLLLLSFEHPIQLPPLSERLEDIPLLIRGTLSAVRDPQDIYHDALFDGPHPRLAPPLLVRLHQLARRGGDAVEPLTLAGLQLAVRGSFYESVDAASAGGAAKSGGWPASAERPSMAYVRPSAQLRQAASGAAQPDPPAQPRALPPERFEPEPRPKPTEPSLLDQWIDRGRRDLLGQLSGDRHELTSVTVSQEVRAYVAEHYDPSLHTLESISMLVRANLGAGIITARVLHVPEIRWNIGLSRPFRFGGLESPLHQSARTAVETGTRERVLLEASLHGLLTLRDARDQIDFKALSLAMGMDYTPLYRLMSHKSKPSYGLSQIKTWLRDEDLDPAAIADRADQRYLTRWMEQQLAKHQSISIARETSHRGHTLSSATLQSILDQERPEVGASLEGLWVRLFEISEAQDDRVSK